MLINFHCNFSKKREMLVANAFAVGCKYEVRFTQSPEPLPNGDIDIAIGIKSSNLVKRFTRPYLWFDKPYNRNWPKWWRIIKGAHHPTDYLMGMDVSGDRATQQGWRFPGWQYNEQGHFLIAGSSDKLHAYFGLKGANEWAQDVVDRIRAAGFTNKIVYRPKYSFKAARPVRGASFSFNERGIADDLKGAYAVITYASAASLDALLAGIPVIALGPTVARPLSATQIDAPLYASVRDCQHLLNALAYTQFSIDEIKSGVVHAYKLLP